MPNAGVALIMVGDVVHAAGARFAAAAAGAVFLSWRIHGVAIVLVVARRVKRTPTTMMT